MIVGDKCPMAKSVQRPLANIYFDLKIAQDLHTQSIIEGTDNSYIDLF